MRWVLALAFLVVLRGAFPELVEADDVRFGLRAVTPYVVVDDSGNFSGLEYEILKAALAVKGHTLRPVVLPLARLVATFRDGGVEAAAPILARHQSGGTLSRPYLIYHNVVLTLASSSLELRSVQDLSNLSLVAFQTARTVLGTDFAAAVSSNVRYREEAQQIIQVKLLYSGRVQAVIGDSRILRSLAALPEAGVDASLPTQTFALFAPTAYSAAFSDPMLAQDFDAGLEAIRNDGTYDRIVERYR